MASWSLLSETFVGLFRHLPPRIAIAVEGDQLVVFSSWGEDRSDGPHAGYWAFDLIEKKWKRREFQPPELVVDLEGSALRRGEEVIIYPHCTDGTFPVTRRCNLQTNTVLEQRGREVAGDIRACGNSGHSAVVWQDQLVVFGGRFCPRPDVCLEDRLITNQIHSLNLKTSEWTLLKPKGDVPEPRGAHSAVLWQGKMIIFGGVSDTSGVDEFLNETWAFDLTKSQWSLLRPTSALPEGRQWHSAIVAGDQMVIFGGDNSRGDSLSDTWALDLRSQQWKQLSFTGAMPEERCLHSAALWGNRMLVLGGRENEDLWCVELEKTRPTAKTRPKAEPKMEPMGPKVADAELPTPRSDAEWMETARAITSATIEDATQAMKTLPANAEVQKWGCMALALCNGHQKTAMEAGALSCVITAMKAHSEHPQIQDWGSQALGALCAGKDDEAVRRKEQALAEGALEVLKAASRTDQASAKRQALFALGSLCSGEDTARPLRVIQAIDLEVMPVLRDALADEGVRTARKVLGALLYIASAAPDEVGEECLQLVEKALARHAANQDIQSLGRGIQEATMHRECSLEPPKHWSSQSQDSWVAYPVTGETLVVLKNMLRVHHPDDLGKGRDVGDYPPYKDLKVHCAWRIENDECWSSFALARSKLQKSLRRIRAKKIRMLPWQSKIQEVSKALPGGTFLNEAGERYLLHGAGPETLMHILHTGFDQSLSNLRGMFGAGCYFAEDSEKMDQYAKVEKDRTPGLDKFHSRLYGTGNTRPDGDVFYCLVVRLACGASFQTNGLDDSKPPRDVDSGQEVFASSDRRQLVQIPGTEPAERFHTLVVNLAKSKVRGVFRFREFVSFRGEAVYPEYLVAYQRILK